MAKSGQSRRVVRTVLFGVIVLSAPVIGLVIGIGILYWTIPPFPVQVDGDPLFAYDPDIGFVSRPNGSTRWTALGPDGRPTLAYHLYTDRRGARVSHRGEQSPAHVDILVVGDSFTWGHGVENQETFAFKTLGGLDATGANLALPGYGTTHAYQMLGRNRDLTPKLIVYGVNIDHPRRNISACAPSVYPFCTDYSHVAWHENGQPYIAPPWSNGVARVHRQLRKEQHGLAPVTWLVHGVDVAVAQLRYTSGRSAALDKAKQEAALEFLVGRMAHTASELKATLVIVYLPEASMSPSPQLLVRSAPTLGYRFLDLTQAFMSLGIRERSALYLPNDGHPSAAGHALIAEQLIGFIRREGLLAR